MSLQNYVVFKFYVPDYAIQSRPIPIKASEVNKYGWKHALWKARDIFLSIGLKPMGEIHDSHERLWQDGRVTYKPKIRRLTAKQVSTMKGRLEPAEERKVGWKRRYKRKRRRRRR